MDPQKERKNVSISGSSKKNAVPQEEGSVAQSVGFRVYEQGLRCRAHGAIAQVLMQQGFTGGGGQ